MATYLGTIRRRHRLIGSLFPCAVEGKTSWYARKYLKQNFQQQNIRLLIALRGSNAFNNRDTNFSGVTRESILSHYQRTVIGHELLMNGFNRFLPTKEAFEVSETGNCKLPVHAIWALPLGRVASISQNTAGV